MMCSAYFGELCDERKQEWYYKDDNPYAVLRTSIELDRKGHKLLSCGQEYFSERIQIDWGSFAWKSTEEQILKFLGDHQSNLPWLVEDDVEMIKQVKQYIKKYGNTLYGVVFVEEC